MTLAVLASTPVAAETSVDPDSTPVRAESTPGSVTVARLAGAVTLAVLASTPAVAEASDSHACMQMQGRCESSSQVGLPCGERRR